MFAIKDETESHRESWIEHVERMPEEQNIIRKMFIIHKKKATLVVLENG